MNESLFGELFHQKELKHCWVPLIGEVLYLQKIIRCLYALIVAAESSG
jgi:hypothetical protein